MVVSMKLYNPFPKFEKKLRKVEGGVLLFEHLLLVEED